MSRARALLPPLVSGTLFGAGLALSGMTDPVRVRGFLDISGRWDPTLAFVMAGAVVVMAIAWQLQSGMKRPVFGEKFSLPDRRDIDRRLIAGAALFGMGWGLSGLCPGPAMASLALSPIAVFPFVIAMLAGMGLHKMLPTTRNRPKIQGA